MQRPFCETSRASFIPAKNPCSSFRLGSWSVGQLKEREESFFQDVEDSGEEESQSKEDEQLVCQLSPVVLEDESPPQVDGSCHIFELLIVFLHRPGGSGCGW